MLKELEEFFDVVQHPDKLQLTFPGRFYTALKTIIDNLEKKLEPEAPSINADLWRERKLQVKIFRFLLDVAEKSQDANELFKHTYFICKRYCTTAFPYSTYNDFKSKLEKLIDETYPSHLCRAKSEATIWSYARRTKNKTKEAIKKLATYQEEMRVKILEMTNSMAIIVKALEDEKKITNRLKEKYPEIYNEIFIEVTSVTSSSQSNNTDYPQSELSAKVGHFKTNQLNSNISTTEVPSSTMVLQQ